MSDAMVTDASERDWRTLYTVGGVVAFVALSGMVFDIVLTMLPGWGAETVPTGAAAWFAQFSANPLLGMRNLDFLNIVLSAVSLAMYVAIYGALRLSAPASALLGLVLVAMGTVLFVGANAALPMLELGRLWADASDEAVRTGLAFAAETLLARGAHGSLGAYPGFFLSEIGTLVVALAMLRGSGFGRTTAWFGIIGTVTLLAYTTAFTFGRGDDAMIMAVAIPGGLLMIAWQARVGLRLLRLGRKAATA